MDENAAIMPASRREGWREFIAAFREMNGHLPEVRAALAGRPMTREEYERLYETPEPKKALKEPETCDLYFIRSASGPIKIGQSYHVAKRLKVLQTASPTKLELLCVVKDAGGMEPDYHERFAEHRMHGEWFEAVPELLAEIDRLTALQAQTGGGL